MGIVSLVVQWVSVLVVTLVSFHMGQWLKNSQLLVVEVKFD